MKDKDAYSKRYERNLMIYLCAVTFFLVSPVIYDCILNEYGKSHKKTTVQGIRYEVTDAPWVSGEDAVHRVVEYNKNGSSEVLDPSVVYYLGDIEERTVLKTIFGSTDRPYLTLDSTIECPHVYNENFYTLHLKSQ